MFFVAILILCLAGANAGRITREVGSWNAPDHKYPYQISLRHRRPRNLSDIHFCSGTILNEKFILTAAHCFDYPRDWSNVWVVAGTNYLDRNGEYYKSEKIILHDNYENFYDNDIALIRVEGRIRLHSNAQKVVLPTQDFTKSNIMVDVAGWGDQWLDANQPTNALQEVTLKIISNQECRKNRRHVTERNVCTYTGNHRGLCGGDSGGPLVVDGVQVGIVSYINQCAGMYPEVYTKVYSHLAWIAEAQRKNSL